MDLILADEQYFQLCIVCLSFKADEEEEEGSVVHRKSLRKTLRERKTLLE